MKTIFIVNPKAGQGKDVSTLCGTIQEAGEKLQKDVEIYITKRPGDGESFVREYCQKHGSARFIACGGDGTLNEVLNGAMGQVGAEIGVLPSGTGNDFVRNFPDAGDFLSPEAQLLGETVVCDAMSYQEMDRGAAPRYSANMFNIGFDCNVADMAARLKKKPLISGSMAYFLGIFLILIQKKGADLRIVTDGSEQHNGPLLLCSMAKGSFCGGGIKSNPLASIQDGKININIIYNISRLNFLSKLPLYMKGTHLGKKGIEKVISTEKFREIIIEPKGGEMRVSVDGEIKTIGRAKFEILPAAFSFVIPKKSSV